MNRYINILLTIFIALSFAACSVEPAPEKETLRPIRYQEVSFSKNEKQRSFSGTVVPSKTIGLSFRSNGVMTYLNLKVGQKVQKGQVLARLDNVQYKLAHEQAMTQEYSAVSQMNTAKMGLDRVRILFEKGSASLSDFEQAKNFYRTTQQSLEAVKKGVAMQKEQLSYSVLYAPQNGVIAEVNAEINENIGPGQPIAVLNTKGKKEIQLGIPETVINSISEGDKVNVSFASNPNRSFPATVSELAPSLTPYTATYSIKVQLSEDNEEIKSGMSAKVEFNFVKSDTDKSNVYLPLTAVGEDSNGRFVYVIEKSKSPITVKKQMITIEDLTIQGFKVKDGLQEGQLIATAGLNSLWDGQAVVLHDGNTTSTLKSISQN